jgi:predicted PolB exonuclease-like 3'-5' exonuclease
MLIDIKNTLIIDIETVSSSESYHSLSDRLKTQWDRKATLIKNEDNLSPDELFFKRAGIYAEFGKIVCIAAGLFIKTKSGQLSLRVKAFGSKNEKKILAEFKELVDGKLDAENLILCAHNGKEFDFPYLCRRYLVNKLEIPIALQIAGKKPWEIRHIDTLEMWKFGDRRHYTSLDLLAAIFDIESSKSTIDGSMVNKVYYQDDDLDEIVEYCKQDVLVTANLYLRLNLMSVIPKENVIYV